MTRVLDLDLDFFVHGVAFMRAKDDDRLPEDEYQPWSLDESVHFLTEQCLLTDKLPGFVVENHDDLFDLWRNAVSGGAFESPFHVTHVDAHADLGMGDSGYT